MEKIQGEAKVCDELHVLFTFCVVCYKNRWCWFCN